MSHEKEFRDLGTGLKNLTILWMARCHLSNLEGLGSLSALKELYVAFNHIQEIETIGLLENLEILDIEG